MAKEYSFNVNEFNDFLIDYLEKHPEFTCDVTYSDETITLFNRIPSSAIDIGIKSARNPQTEETFGPIFIIGNVNSSSLSCNCNDINSITGMTGQWLGDDLNPDQFIFSLVNGGKIELLFHI